MRLSALSLSATRAVGRGSSAGVWDPPAWEREICSTRSSPSHIRSLPAPPTAAPMHSCSNASLPQCTTVPMHSCPPHSYPNAPLPQCIPAPMPLCPNTLLPQSITAPIYSYPNTFLPQCPAANPCELLPQYTQAQMHSCPNTSLPQCIPAPRPCPAVAPLHPRSTCPTACPLPPLIAPITAHPNNLAASIIRHTNSLAYQQPSIPITKHPINWVPQ